MFRCVSLINLKNDYKTTFEFKVNPKRTNRPGLSTTNRGYPRAGRYRARISRGAYYGYRPTRRPRYKILSYFQKLWTCYIYIFLNY